LAWIALIVMVGLLGAGWIYASREPAAVGPTALMTAPYVGSLAPDFTLQTIDGRTINLSDYTAGSGRPVVGTPVVLNFWATWCPPCRIEMPYFESAGQRYGDDVIILGLNQAESAEIIAAYARDNGLTYPLLVDEDMKVNNLYGVLNLPTTIFIDRNGIVREVLIGTISRAVLEDRIEKLLDS
jgi:cytochrome c biogenesis protein CcmG/thiol:disulfide interchange protein DsbE